ncbi:HNH endonuclease [Streptomyces smyrnaeus]|uniref:HNH endonuclease n=1 Tax=Streptomyces smyrnaeus TaxID=1387713 RepID=UPI003693B6F4
MPRAMCRRCNRLIPIGAALCGPCLSAPPKRRTYGNKTKKTAERGYNAQWRRTVKAAIEKQPYCSHCGTNGNPLNPLTGDHILPISKGGTNDAANCRVLCRSCNSSRGNRNY